MTDSEPHMPADDAVPRPGFAAVPQPEKLDGVGGPSERRRHPWVEAAEGAIGWFILLVLAAVGGALVVVYWPWMTGSGADETAMADRVSALERQVGQLAAGRAPEVAAASFAAVERRLGDLKNRLDADEARLSAVEKSQNAASGPAPVDVAALTSAVAKNSRDLAAAQRELQQLAAASSANRPSGPTADSKSLPRLPAQPTIAGVQALRMQTAGQLARLDHQVQQLGQQLGRVEQRVGQLAKASAPANLAQQLQSFAPKSAVAMLEQQVARIERSRATGGMRKAATMLALAELVRASANDAPYGAELNVLRPLVPPSPAMTTLERHAAQGAPTLPELTRRFDAIADSVLSAERTAHARNWLARAWMRLDDLISVRQVGNVAGNTTQARLARAGFALAHADLAAAVKEVEGLDTPARRAAHSWLLAARARLAIDRAARNLTQTIMVGRQGRPMRQPAATDGGP